jgi:hypothetical protein
MPRPTKQAETEDGSESRSQTGENTKTKFMRDSDGIPRFEGLLRKYGPSLLFLSILTIVIIDIFSLASLSVNWPTVALIAMLVIIPYLRDLKRIEVANMGSVELQSDIESARQLVEKLGTKPPEKETGTNEDSPELSEEKLSQFVQMLEEKNDSEVSEEKDEDSEVSEEVEEDSGIGPRPQARVDTGEAGEDTDRDAYGERVDPVDKHYGGYVGGIGGSIDQISDEIYSLLEKNPRVALAKLRMELEEEIRRTIQNHQASSISEQNPQHLQPSEQARVLKYIGIVDENFVQSYVEVRELCNKAIHGEEIKTQDAIDIVDLGLNILRYLKSIGNEK